MIHRNNQYEDNALVTAFSLHKYENSTKPASSPIQVSEHSAATCDRGAMSSELSETHACPIQPFLKINLTALQQKPDDPMLPIDCLFLGQQSELLPQNSGPRCDRVHTIFVVQDNRVNFDWQTCNLLKTSLTEWTGSVFTSFQLLVSVPHQCKVNHMYSRREG